MRSGLLALAVVTFAAGAMAQDSDVSSSNSAADMAQLIDQGYEIRAAVPNGTRFVVFLQKEKSAYACEFASVTSSRCKAIN